MSCQSTDKSSTCVCKSSSRKSRSLPSSQSTILFLFVLLSSKGGYSTTPPSPLTFPFRNIGLRQRPSLQQCSTAVKKQMGNTGFYYGLNEDLLKRTQEQQKEEETEFPSIIEEEIIALPLQEEEQQPLLPSPEVMISEMTQKLSEFKSKTEDLQKTLSYIQDQMSKLQKSFVEQKDGIFDSLLEDDEDGIGDLGVEERRRQFENVASDVEEWAYDMLNEKEGWQEVRCHKLLRGKFKKHGNVRCFVKWLPDSRQNDDEDNENHDPTKTYPCMKVFATIDAPMDQVCHYLSDPDTLPEYNDLIVQHSEIEQIAPHSKICWATCPQVLFIKPRDFVTFCHLKWKGDGTQIVVNQAVDHQEKPGRDAEKDGKVCRAYALRGAHIISRDPEDERKTRFALLAHGNPGGNLPPWAMKTAVNSIAPIEPFKLFHRIEHGANRIGEKAELVSSKKVSERPGGLSGMGYACFWPNGGGLKEDGVKNKPMGSSQDVEEE